MNELLKLLSEVLLEDEGRQLLREEALPLPPCNIVDALMACAVCMQDIAHAIREPQTYISEEPIKEGLQDIAHEMKHYSETQDGFRWIAEAIDRASEND